MTDGIGRLSGYGNYGVGGYMPQRQDGANSKAPEEQVVVNNYEETQVDPSKVMDFLANNNLFVEAPKTGEAGAVDPATQERVAGYMEKFEMIYAVVAEEFGEELAPAVMDMVMDKLMGIE